MVQNYSQISTYARRFFSGTLVSRISGMVRDVGMAVAFGDHPSVAAFMVAFRFSHFLRRLLGEGTLQSIFIPQYQELQVKDKMGASAFFFQLSLLLLWVLIGLSLLVEGTIGFWFGFSNEIVYLFSLMFPSLIFISLYGLNISLLQCQNVFFTSSIAPFACNVIWIAAVFFLAQVEVSRAMSFLAFFILLGFMVQWLVTLPHTWRVLQEGRRHRNGSLFSLPKDIRKIGRATFLGFIGVAAVQLNSFLDMLFAHYADVRGPIYLWYAIRLEQLPLALIGFACVYSVTPSLSALIKAGEQEKAKDLFLFGYRRILLLVIPCIFAVLALGYPSIQLLFGRGSFSLHAVIETTWCLWAYGLSLLPAILVIYQSSLFYAYSDFKTPMVASLFSVMMNVILNGVFVFLFHWGAFSIALSTSLCSCMNYWLLKRKFREKKHLLVAYPSFSSFGSVLLVGGIAWLGCLLFDRFFLGAFFFQESLLVEFSSFISQVAYFVSQLFVFIFLTSACLLFLHKEMFFEMKKILFAKESV